MSVAHPLAAFAQHTVAARRPTRSRRRRGTPPTPTGSPMARFVARTFDPATADPALRVPRQRQASSLESTASTAPR